MTRQLPNDISVDAFDVIVVGAGVNGAGLARDAAMRGLRVLVLDKGDLAGGTSAWSTRLVHGGLRYLEHGEVGLVRESLRERETLMRRVAPHLVRPLPILIPVYEGRRRGAFTVAAGMIAYDLLSFDKSLDDHQMLSPEETLRRAPALNPEGLRGSGLYQDAQVAYAERLVVENALSARRHGAFVLTYARVDAVMIEDARVRGVEYTDLRSGLAHAARACVVVNASGPWADEVLRGAGRDFPRMIGGTKGSHVVVEKFPSAPPCALYAEARRDARPFFVIPWDGKILIGTTDTRYEGDLDCVAADEEEIAFLLDETNRLLPAARLTRDDVLYAYAGVRPLPFAPEGDEAGITRRHFIRDHAPEAEGLLSVVGGKLTTYRSLSEWAVDAVFEKLGRRVPPCSTAAEPLPGAAADTGESFAEFAESFLANASLPRSLLERLLNVYGVRAAEVLRRAKEEPELLEPLTPAGDTIGAQVVYSFTDEMAETLCDCLLRRTMTGLNGEAGLDVVEAAARVAREHLGWDEARAAREVNDYREYVRRFHPRRMR